MENVKKIQILESGPLISKGGFDDVYAAVTVTVGRVHKRYGIKQAEVADEPALTTYWVVQDVETSEIWMYVGTEKSFQAKVLATGKIQ